MAASVTGMIDPEVQESQDKLEYYYQAASQWMTESKEDEDFANGAQWTSEQVEALEAKNMSPIVVNVVGPTVDQAVAMLTTKKPKFAATAREDSDTKTAKLFTDIMSYVWDYSDGNTQLKQAVHDYYVKGLGYLMAYYDPDGDFGQGAINLRAVNPFEVFVDPNVKDRYFSDASDILIASVKTKEQIANLYPDYIEKVRESDAVDRSHIPASSRYGSEGQTYYDGYLDPDHDHYELLDRYTKIKVPQYRINIKQLDFVKVFNPNEFEEYRKIQTYSTVRGDEVRYALTEQEIAQTEQMLKTVGEVFHLVTDPESGNVIPTPGPAEEDPYGIPGSTTTIVPLTFGDLMDQGVIQVDKFRDDRIKRVLSVGYTLLFSQVLPIREYPIIPFVNRFHRNPYPDSDVRLSKPLQEFINKMRSLIIAHASNSTSTKVLLPRGAVNKEKLEMEWSKAGTSVIEFEAELGTPVVAGPVPLPNELYQLEANAKSEIEFIFGIWQVQHGNPQAMPDTYKGTIAIDEFGQRRIKSKKDDIEGAINRLARVVVQLIQRYWTKERTLRLVQPSDKNKETKINIPIYDDLSNEIIGKLNDVTVGQYDVIMISGSTLPSARWARFEYYLKLYQLGIIDGIELLKQTEVVDTQAVLERKSMYQQMQNALQQAQEQIKNLTGDLQTAQREAVHANKKSELSAFKSKLKEIELAVQLAKDKTKLNLDHLYKAVELKEESKSAQEAVANG